MTELSRAYTTRDIKDKLDDCVNVITYEELNNYDDILDALYPFGNLVILYETDGTIENNVGHWVTVILGEEGDISVFDPYGFKIDEPNELLSKKVRLIENQDFNTLSLLLALSNLPVDYNEHELQEFKKGINTCGLWAIARIMNNHLTNDEFYELFKGDKEINPDELVYKYVNSLHPGDYMRLHGSEEDADNF